VSEAKEWGAICYAWAHRRLVALLFLRAVFSISGSTRSGSEDTILLVWILPCIHYRITTKTSLNYKLAQITCVSNKTKTRNMNKKN